ncbi:hypothetical protein BDR07DRAFT_1611017 [Suillus spraguei]|nr:hypothetical protein BDR07DRAFT_1611017 [Suillus spraguei]
MAPDQLLPRKTRLEMSYAFSRTFNSRNLEFYWYPLWCQTLCDLVADVPYLIVAPQFPVWIVDHNDQLEGADDGGDPEEVEELEKTTRGEQASAGDMQALDNDAEEEDHELEVGDLSFASTAPEKDTKGVLVDFTVVHLTAVPQPQQEEESRYGGWRITAVNACLLVEVKRFASRSLEGNDLDEDIKLRIEEARNDVIAQAGYLFLQDETKDSVMVIAAAGPYWSGATIHRDDVKRTMDQLSNNDPNYRPPSEQLFDLIPKWNTILRLDGASSTVASEARLRTICKKMKEIGDQKTIAK